MTLTIVRALESISTLRTPNSTTRWKIASRQMKASNKFHAHSGPRKRVRTDRKYAILRSNSPRKNAVNRISIKGHPGHLAVRGSVCTPIKMVFNKMMDPTSGSMRVMMSLKGGGAAKSSIRTWASSATKRLVLPHTSTSLMVWNMATSACAKKISGWGRCRAAMSWPTMMGPTSSWKNGAFPLYNGSKRLGKNHGRPSGCGVAVDTVDLLLR
mmetsp:Transcript_59277/g.157784  ORF Transcript_59277/g.157784 Transcript_59277/m.157784 type:complete len:212 (-) Transcript_59277:602-1237(-)